MFESCFRGPFSKYPLQDILCSVLGQTRIHFQGECCGSGSGNIMQILTNPDRHTEEKWEGHKKKDSTLLLNVCTGYREVRCVTVHDPSLAEPDLYRFAGSGASLLETDPYPILSCGIF
jgi:hypothetical protein